MMNKSKFSAARLILSAFIATGSSAAISGDVAVSSGFDVSRGSYGETTDTDILYFPLSVKYSAFPWKARVTASYISISGPDSVTAAADSAVINNSQSVTETTESGIGDTVASLTYALDSIWNKGPFIDLTGKVKLPTADAEKRLGTGESDYQLQLDIARTFNGLTPFTTIGYKVIGDTADTDYNNVVYTSIGADQKLNHLFSIGFSYDFMQATSSTSDDRKELMGYLNWKINKAYSVNAYGVAGMTDASPDYALGLQLTVRQQ